MRKKRKRKLSIEIETRTLKEARHIIEHKCTIRQAAVALGGSKSSVHKDVTERLSIINPSLANTVRKVLDKNKAERHIRGGLATQKKAALRRAQIKAQNK